MPLHPGDKIDRYEIVASLGAGGMGEVYRARDARLQRDVALKILRAEDSGTTGPLAAERILREARAAAALDHPNVIAIYDVGELVLPGETEGTAYIAMELIKGRSLREMVGDLSIPIAERVRWLTEAARALSAAHKAGLVHRDVKPENVMLRDDGVVKVLDFGVAKRAPPSASVPPGLSSLGHVLSTLGPHSSTAGTPYYMAPEQMRSERLDGRADQFAWGVMAYEILAGRPPWTSTDDMLQLVAQILSEEPPPPRRHNPEISPALEAVVLRALSKVRSERFASMDALLSTMGGERPTPAPDGARAAPAPDDEPGHVTGDPDVDARARERIGTVLRGKYTVDSVLGVGGMAVVYAVTHRNRKRFALKLLHPELSRGRDIKDRFLREGYVANTVGHSGAVAVIDDDVMEDGSAFLVMELLEGKSVDRIWENVGQRMPLRAVGWIAHQLLDVLAAAHAKGVVHRDIKPANLFVTVDGTLKVLDFGIARIRETQDPLISTTNTGAMMGTPAFMSPEQAGGKYREVDAQTDVWAVGATMFTLLTGRIVHEAENGHALLVAAATTDARPVATLAPGTPPALCAVIDRALARSKADRWPSAGAMREALTAAHVEAFGAPLSRAVLDELDAIEVRMRSRRGPEASPPGVSADSPTLDAPPSASPGMAEGRVVTRPTTPSVNPLAMTAVASTGGPGPEMSTAKPVSWRVPSPAAQASSRGRGARLALVVGVPAAVLLLLGGGYAVVRSRGGPADATGGPPGATVTVSTAAAEPPAAPAPPPQESATVSASLTEPSAAPPVPATPTAPGTKRASPPGATAAPSSRATAPVPQGNCFYFDPKLNRLVAKPGCR